MGFTITHEVPSPTNVTVKFAGLILLEPNGADHCNVCIHRLSTAHLFQAILVIHKPGLPATLHRLIHGHLQREFTIEATRAGAAFRAFQLDESEFDRTTDNHPFDHRWSVNMRSLHPHAEVTEGARPVATLNDGVLFTSNLTRPDLNPALVKGQDRRPLHKIAADLAVALNATPDQKIRLTWTEDKKPFYLPRQNDPAGTTYTLMLVNDPPITNATPHDELMFYYDVLQENGAPIPAADQWTLDYDDPKSDEIPCMPVEMNPPG